MTYETHIITREGHMQNGEHVSDRAEAVAVELETGMSAGAVAVTDEDAREAAAQALESKIREWAQIENRARNRAKEDPEWRLKRLEAFAREHGFDG